MSTESKKPSKVVYDRTGTRYWCIPTPNQNSTDTDKLPNCCPAHQKEYLAQHPEKLYSYNLPSSVQSKESSQRKSSEQDFDSPINLPKFQQPRRERSSSLPLPNELLMSNFLAYPGQPEEDETDNEDDDEYSYNDSDYDGFEFSHPLQGYLSESQEAPFTTPNEKKKVDDNVAVELNSDSLWKSKSIIEERDLSLKHFYSLSLPERKNVVKVQKDAETFLKNLSSKNRSRQNRSNSGKNELCNCSNCDPKRVLSEVDFQAFLTRCKMARTMVAAATIEQSSDKIPRDVQEVYEPEFSSTLKKKIYETALKFLEDGQTYLEISNRFLTEELKALAACPNKDPSDSYGDPTDFPPDMFPNDPYTDDAENSSSDSSPTTSNFQAIAAQMISLNPHHSSKLSGISFRNGPPPRAFAISTTEYDSDHNCHEKCCIQHISHFRCTDSDEADSPNSDERFRSIMEKATDYDSLVKIYVTKIFDHRILNHFQERQIQIKQEKLIEEFQQEEKKTKPKPKKGKKKTKNTKQYEEMIARKKDEARLEEEARKLREAKEKEMEQRRLREEEELAARVEKARAINRQAKEEAEKNKKAAPKISIAPQNTQLTKNNVSFQSSLKAPKAGAYNSSTSDSQPSLSSAVSKDASSTIPKTTLIKTTSSPKTASITIPSTIKQHTESKSGASNLANSQSKTTVEPSFLTAPKSPAVCDPPRLLPGGNNDSDWPSLKEIPAKSPSTRTKKEVSDSKTTLPSTSKSLETSQATSKSATALTLDDPLPSNSGFITNLSWASNLPNSTGVTGSQSHSLFSPTFPQLPAFNPPPYGAAPFNSFNPPPGSIFPNNIPLTMNPLMSSTSDRLQTNGLPALQRPVWNDPSYRTAFNNIDLNRGNTAAWPANNNLPQATIGNNVIPSNFNDMIDSTLPSLRSTPFPNTPPINFSPIDSLSGISINYIMEIQDNIRHSYFTLLLGMGLDLTIQTQKRPFVPLVDLYLKYKSLFISKIDSIVQFHQICSCQLPQPGSSLLVNAFQFQSSPNHPNILIRYALGLVFNSEIPQPPVTSLLSFNPGMWNAPKLDHSLGVESNSFSPLPSDLFSNEQTEPFSIPPITSDSSLNPPIFSSGGGSSF